MGGPQSLIHLGPDMNLLQTKAEIQRQQVGASQTS